KPQWTLTLKGWGILLGIGLLTTSLILTYLQPFLAVSQPIVAQALVVEGWVNEEGINAAKKEFEQGDYQLLITTGENFGKGSVFMAYQSYANLAKVMLQNLGLAPETIVAIPSSRVQKDRTAASAKAVKEWLLTSSPPIQAINLYSSDVHSRRSWLIYQRILSPQFSVGILSFPSPYYDPHRWWLYSEGVRSVLSEAIAYFYAVLIWPFTQH
ncbi:MAG: ElyC/SanA/YdcF family protein, partial [Microcystaceae cyanobacterium]